MGLDHASLYVAKKWVEKNGIKMAVLRYDSIKQSLRKSSSITASQTSTTIGVNDEADREAKLLAAGLPTIMSVWRLVDTRKVRLNQHFKEIWKKYWSSLQTITGKLYTKHSQIMFFLPAFFGKMKPSKCPSPKSALTG